MTPMPSTLATPCSLRNRSSVHLYRHGRAGRPTGADVTRIPYSLLLVEWIDSCTHGEAWERVADLMPELFAPTEHFSVGWEMKRTKNALTLGANLGSVGDSHNETVSGLFTIPLVTIKREVVLRKAHL